jgi:hypothetical protein
MEVTMFDWRSCLVEQGYYPGYYDGMQNYSYRQVALCRPTK